MSSQIAICNFKKHNYTNEIDDIQDTEFGTTEYSYLTDLDKLEKGSIVVVETKYGLELAQFVRYSKRTVDMDRATRWIIQTVDLTEFLERKEKELQREALLEQMRNIKDSALELEIFSKLAESSPLMADLLSKYNKL